MRYLSFGTKLFLYPIAWKTALIRLHWFVAAYVWVSLLQNTIIMHFLTALFDCLHSELEWQMISHEKQKQVEKGVSLRHRILNVYVVSTLHVNCTFRKRIHAAVCPMCANKYGVGHSWGSQFINVSFTVRNSRNKLCGASETQWNVRMIVRILHRPPCDWTPPKPLDYESIQIESVHSCKKNHTTMYFNAAIAKQCAPTQLHSHGNGHCKSHRTQSQPINSSNTLKRSE